jgi:hypothetical protein
VQYVYAQHESRFPPIELDGGVLATNVRNQFFWYAGLPKFKQNGFRVQPGANRSVLLLDPEGVQIKIRKHPRRPRRGLSELVPVTPPDDPATDLGQPTLFGPKDEYEPVLWGPTLLWDADPQSQSLCRAWLGALEREADNPRVFGKLQLSIGSPSLLADDLTRSDRPSVALGFDDMFGDAEKGDFLT